MMDLSERQLKILKALIEEYIDTAEPVGSETLDKKYNLGVSPATIRNEMVKLTKMGLLKQPHTSAGRVPTPQGLRFYVDNLMQPRKLSVAEEVAIKEKIWDYRHELDKLLREATKALAQRTRTLAVTATDEGNVYYAGTANILEMSEFYDIDLTKTILSLLDEFEYWQSLLDQIDSSLRKASIFLGEEFGQDRFKPFGGIFMPFQLPKQHQGAIGALGPGRLDYSSIIPVVNYVGELLDDMLGKW